MTPWRHTIFAWQWWLPKGCWRRSSRCWGFGRSNDRGSIGHSCPLVSLEEVSGRKEGEVGWLVGRKVRLVGRKVRWVGRKVRWVGRKER